MIDFKTIRKEEKRNISLKLEKQTYDLKRKSEEIMKTTNFKNKKKMNTLLENENEKLKVWESKLILKLL